MFVGLTMTTFVFVADAILIGIVEVVNEEVMVAPGNGVPVINEAPGVRKRLIQTGSVRMEGSTGSINPLGLRVRKSLFGSRFDSIFVFNFQLGEKRSAHCPATITHRNPIPKIRGIMNQSRRSCSGAFIDQSIVLATARRPLCRDLSFHRNRDSQARCVHDERLRCRVQLQVRGQDRHP